MTITLYDSDDRTLTREGRKGDEGRDKVGGAQRKKKEEEEEEKHLLFFSHRLHVTAIMLAAIVSWLLLCFFCRRARDMVSKASLG